MTGELLELRPLRADDYDSLFGVASDPLIWEQHPNRDRYKEEVFEIFFREALESRGALVATDSKTGEVIGSSRFHGYGPEKDEVEIGWTFLARSHWGGHYNGEMKRLMLQHAFKFVTRVIFLIGEHNLRSRRAVEKIGAVQIGSRHRDGKNCVLYQITKPGMSESKSRDSVKLQSPPRRNLQSSPFRLNRCYGPANPECRLPVRHPAKQRDLTPGPSGMLHESIGDPMVPSNEISSLVQYRWAGLRIGIRDFRRMFWTTPVFGLVSQRSVDQEQCPRALFRPGSIPAIALVVGYSKSLADDRTLLPGPCPTADHFIDRRSAKELFLFLVSRVAAEDSSGPDGTAGAGSLPPGLSGPFAAPTPHR